MEEQPVGMGDLVQEGAVKPKKPNARKRMLVNLALDRWVLNLIANRARKWCPLDCAFSAFLSEVATVPWLRKYLP